MFSSSWCPAENCPIYMGRCHKLCRSYFIKNHQARLVQWNGSSGWFQSRTKCFCDFHHFHFASICQKNWQIIQWNTYCFGDSYNNQYVQIWQVVLWNTKLYKLLGPVGKYGPLVDQMNHMNRCKFLSVPPEVPERYLEWCPAVPPIAAAKLAKKAG